MASSSAKNPRSRYDIWKMYSFKSCENKRFPQHIVIKPFVRKSVSPNNRFYSTENRCTNLPRTRHNSETNLVFHHQARQQAHQPQHSVRRNSLNNQRGRSSGSICRSDLLNRSAKCIVCVSVICFSFISI